MRACPGARLHAGEENYFAEAGREENQAKFVGARLRNEYSQA